MSVSEAEGNLFDPDFDFDCIGHGVNCFGLMGSGIAVQFKNRFPVMHRNYMELCGKDYLLPGMVYPWYENAEVPYVFNIASQYHPGPDANLDYLEAGLLYCRFYMRQHDLTHLGLPQIGAGIGGLRFADVLECVQSVFGPSPDTHVTVITYKP